MTLRTEDIEQITEIEIDDELHSFVWHDPVVTYRRVGGAAPNVWLKMPSTD